MQRIQIYLATGSLLSNPELAKKGYCRRHFQHQRGLLSPQVCRDCAAALSGTNKSIFLRLSLVHQLAYANTCGYKKSSETVGAVYIERLTHYFQMPKRQVVASLPSLPLVHIS